MLEFSDISQFLLPKLSDLNFLVDLYLRINAATIKMPLILICVFRLLLLPVFSIGNGGWKIVFVHVFSPFVYNRMILPRNKNSIRQEDARKMKNVFLRFCEMTYQALNKAWTEGELKISNMYWIKNLSFQRRKWKKR